MRLAAPDSPKQPAAHSEELHCPVLQTGWVPRLWDVGRGKRPGAVFPAPRRA
jgi:hypothetical protein